MRVILASVLGGLVMFAWGAFSHMVLGVGEAGWLQPANEAALITSFKANVPEAGFYIVPGMDMSHSPTNEEMAAWTAKYKEGPNAILIYHPDGSEAMTPKQLSIEFASNVLAAFLVAIILSLASVGFFRGAIISTAVGLAGWAAIEISYWNWFRFPAKFITGELIDQAAGFFLMGLVLAFILRPRRP